MDQITDISKTLERIAFIGALNTRRKRRGLAKHKFLRIKKL
jgi:hypothetical protein